MPESDAALLTNAAREAGEIACRFWRSDPKTWDKSDSSPVTEADFAVDAHLRQMLTAARPDYGWMSEETEDDDARLNTDRLFIVDPIDGTRAFIAGEAIWAHSLAVVDRGVVTAAVVFLPVRDRLFAATLGQGATLNGDAINATDRADADGATVLSPRINFDPKHWTGTPPDMKRSFRPSLAYRLSLVGQGRYDAMMTLRPSWEWDIAAGALIASEAGATVTDRRGHPLRFNSTGRQTDGVVAAATQVHAKIMAQLA